MACHFDGFISVAAHTFVIGDKATAGKKELIQTLESLKKDILILARPGTEVLNVGPCKVFEIDVCIFSLSTCLGFLLVQ